MLNITKTYRCPICGENHTVEIDLYKLDEIDKLSPGTKKDILEGRSFTCKKCYTSTQNTHN